MGLGKWLCCVTFVLLCNRNASALYSCLFNYISDVYIWLNFMFDVIVESKTLVFLHNNITFNEVDLTQKSLFRAPMSMLFIINF